jgi:hypothetical protein
MEINFIKVLNKNGKIIGAIAVDRGSEEEMVIVNRFLDMGLPFNKATEDEYASFDADVVKRKGRATFCHLLPEE